MVALVPAFLIFIDTVHQMLNLLALKSFFAWILISHQVVETPYKFHSLQSDDIFHRPKRLFHPCFRFRRWNKKVSHRESWDNFERNSWQFCNICDWKIPWAGPWKEYFEFIVQKKLKNSDHWKISIQENSDCRPDELVEIGQYVTRCRVLWEWFKKILKYQSWFFCNHGR